MSEEREALAVRDRDTVRGVDCVEFFDDAYVWWRVTERDARGDPGAHGDYCLIFACAAAVRRVWDYPTSWRTLSASALAALSWHR